MSRLIDADALIEDIRKNSASYFADDFAHEWVDRQPTIEERKTGKWIPCSERLPEKESKEQRRGTYLTTNGYGVVCMMNYEFEGDFGFIGWGTNRPYDLQIVAWMPLPEPWKGEQP